MEDFKKTRVALYIRVSTDEQATKWVSIEHQQESLIEYAKNHWYILNENRNIYVDKWYSWASRNRPALEKLMFDSQNNEFDLVLVKKVDRFFRKNLYLLQYVEELVQNWVWFKAVDQGFNIADSSWKMMLSMLWVIWEMERDLIRDRTISWKVQKAKMWYYVGWWVAKLGYIMEKDWRWNKLILDEEEAKIVKRMFHLYVNENKSFAEICNIFNSEWIQTKYDKFYSWRDTDKRKVAINHWYPWSLWRLIWDEIYIWNYYYWKKWKRYDKRLWKDVDYIKPRSEWLILQSPRIIDDVTFYKAQDLLKKNKTTKNNKNPHVFAWLLKCNCCWRSYVWYKTHKWTMSYRCWWTYTYRTMEETRCYNKEISEKYLVEHIWKKIEEIFKNPDTILEKYYNSKNQNNLIENYRNEFNEILKKIEKYTNWLKNLYKDIYLIENELEKEIKQETIKSMEQELESFNQRRIELNNYIIKLKRIDENKESISKVIKIYKTNIKNTSEENKIELIKEFVDKVILYESWKTVVFFKFTNDSPWDNNIWWGNSSDWDDTIFPITNNTNNTHEVKSLNGIWYSTIFKELKRLTKSNI